MEQFVNNIIRKNPNPNISINHEHNTKLHNIKPNCSKLNSIVSNLHYNWQWDIFDIVFGD